MNPPLPRPHAARPRTAPPVLHEEDLDRAGAEREWSVAPLASADEQWERFALWLRVTDAGHQPC